MATPQPPSTIQGVVPVFPAPGCESCANLSTIIKRVCATNNTLMAQRDEVSGKYQALKVEFARAVERGNRYKDALYRAKPEHFPDRAHVRSPPPQPIHQRAPVNLAREDLPPPPPPGIPPPNPPPLPPMEVDYQPTPRIPFEDRLAQERHRVMQHLQDLPQVNEINQVLNIQPRAAEPPRQRQNTGRPRMPSVADIEMQQVPQAQRPAAPQQPLAPQNPAPAAQIPAARPEPEAPVPQEPEIRFRQAEPVRMAPESVPMPPRPERPGIFSEPSFIYPREGEAYEGLRSRARMVVQEDYAQMQILYGYMMRENEEMAYADLVRFAPVIIQYGLFGHPAAGYFYIDNLRRRVRCLIDTRIGATSMASFDLFRQQPNTQVFTRRKWLHYPYMHQKVELASYDGRTTIQLAHKGKYIPVVMGLTRTWVNTIVIALDILAPFISSLDIVRQQLVLDYDGTPHPHEFFWQTDQLLMSNRPLDQLAAEELERKNTLARDISTAQNHPVRRRGSNAQN
ncbi:hypothetical protein V9T40_005070 [Parthenolecanium corni]|uniref:Uncharacterized protein n=1 Tax=Parthenolecanium corni TaxID=536013 RepID=A0AAN9TDG2_9HEMI